MAPPAHPPSSAHLPSSLHLPSDPAELTRFARDLSPFTVDAVERRLGPRAVAGLDREDPLPALAVTQGQDDPLALLIRLFLLGADLTGAELRAALPTGYQDARSWGIITGTRTVRAVVDLRPTRIGARDVWLAADLGEIATGEVLPGNHVLGLGGASATLVDLTVRNPVARALDLGTGSGIQTLGLVHHAQEVLATDISRRALQFAAFNIALNDAIAAGGGSSARGRVELRAGSFFEPVHGDFDLIVSNPPFVVSPRGASLDTYTYRDGGLEGDGIIAHLIEEIPSYLRPNGVAVLLANWEVHRGQQWDQRIGQWVRATGLDAWVIHREYLDPAHYVHTWIRDGGLTPERDPDRYRAVYLDWLADFDNREVEGISFGYVVLRKPEHKRAPWVRLEEITGRVQPGLGATIGRTLAAVEALSGVSEEDVGTWYLTVADDVTEERYYRPGASDPSVITLRQGGGFCRTVRVDTLTAAVVGACDGELNLGQILAAVAAIMEVEAGAVAAEVMGTIRGLLLDGILVRAVEGNDSLKP